MEEKRVFERIDAIMKIKYEIIQRPPLSKPATSKDISGTGIRLSLDEKLEIGCTIKLEIGLPYEKSKVATTYGEVVWVRKIEIAGVGKSTTYYETGIRFTKADTVTLGRIFKHFKKDNK